MSEVRKSATVYRPEIDGLRAFAVTAVILLHAGAPLHGGFAGVDVFFVISGFLITSILARELAQGRFSLWSFYDRRMRRILPALFVVVLASIPLAFWLMPSLEMRAFERSIIALMVFATNFKFWLQSGYFEPTAAFIPLLHTWSLAVEEQYYLFFPLLLWGLWRFGIRKIWMTLGILTVASLIAAQIAAQSAPGAAFYLLPFRAWELLAGAMAGLWVARSGQPRAGSPYAGVLSLVGLVGIVGSFFLLNEDMALPGLVMVPSILGTVLVLLFAAPGSIAYRILSQRILVGIGLISYSAYLWHQPLLVFGRFAQIGRPPLMLTIALVVATFALAWLTWRFVEEPFRNRQRIRTGPMLGILGVTASVIMAIGLAGHFGFGIGTLRFDAATVAQMEQDTGGGPKLSCERLGELNICRHPADRAPTWAVYGDSHANAIAQAIADRLASQGQGIVKINRNGCAPAIGPDLDASRRQDNCAVWNAEALDWITRQDTITTVILAWRHGQHLFGEHEFTFPDIPDVPPVMRSGQTAAEKRDLYWQGFATIVDRLRAAGKRVIVMAPVPELGATLTRYIVREGHAVDTLDVDTRTFYDARQAFFRDRLAMTDWDILDPVRTLCSPQSCAAIRDGRLLYFDIDHLSFAGAQMVVAPLFDGTDPLQLAE